MKEILILTRAFENGGLEVALVELLKNIDLNKYHVTVHCIEKRGNLSKEIPSAIRIEEIVFNPEKYRIFVNHRKMPNDSVKMILNKIYKKSCEWLCKVDDQHNKYYELVLQHTEKCKKKYDVVLDFYGYGHFLSAYGSRFVQAQKKAMWLHDEKMEWIKLTIPYLQDYDKFYCVSETVQKNFVQRFPELEKKTELLYNYVDIDQIRRLASEPIKDIYYTANYKILTIGRLAEQKGYDYAVEAARILKQNGMEFVWYAIGEGLERKSLESKIREYGLEDYFVLLGRRENPYPYLKACDLYVQPSLHEGYGIAVLEARVLCKPIVISNTPCLLEQIEDGVNGLVAALDGNDIAKKISLIRENELLRNQLIENLKKSKIDFHRELKKLECFLDD
ncbi:MAG: glycosyltransferase [Hespellia sp.]|nr:glycosyltransferase [Hespellia sp.]